MKLTKNQKIFAVVGVAVVVLLFIRSSRKKDVPSGNSGTGGSGGNGSVGVGSDYDYLNPNAFPLRMNSRNNYVSCLQRWLNSRREQTGASRLSVDGVFGSATLAALKKTWKYYYGYETNEITRVDFSREGMSAFDY